MFVLNEGSESEKRIFDDTLQNITSLCSILAKEQYVKRHDKLCVKYTFNLCKEIWVKNRKWTPVWPFRNESWSKVIILWNQQVQTNRIILNNKTDNITSDEEKGTCWITEFANPGSGNVIEEGA